MVGGRHKVNNMYIGTEVAGSSNSMCVRITNSLSGAQHIENVYILVLEGEGCQNICHSYPRSYLMEQPLPWNNRKSQNIMHVF